MARDESPPFPRGGTFYGGGTIDSNNLGGVNLEGKEWKFEDDTYGTGEYVYCRVVRNSGTFNLLPKRLVSFDTSYVGLRVNGYTATTAAPGLPVDEKLPAAGVPANDLFWVVVEGPCAVLTDIASGANNVIAAMDPLVALTAATSGATTAGRVVTAGTGGAAATLNLAYNMVGRACSAKTTANTDSTLLMYAKRWF